VAEKLKEKGKEKMKKNEKKKNPFKLCGEFKISK
jgi:hypothetical protein